MIDAHAHLDLKPLAGRTAALLERAARAGVEGVIQVGGDPDHWRSSLELARRHPQIRAVLALQVHASPTFSPVLLADLEREIRGAGGLVVGLGEIGLDYHYDYPRDRQHAAFRAQLELAHALGLPVVIHSRQAEADTAAILRRERDRRGAPLAGMIHCFSGGPDFAAACLELGLDLSFAGNATWAAAGPIQEAARLAPSDRIHVETDAPYLPPEPIRKVRPNEPAHARHTLRFLAGLRGAAEAELELATTANTRRLFGLA